MFGSWLSNQNSKMRALIWMGIAALRWAIWKTRNDIIFYKIKHNSILQAIVRGRIGYVSGDSCSVMSTTRTYSLRPKKMMF
jgi:hypothetical protein